MAIQRNRAEATVEELFTLFRSSGHAGYSSERVSQLEHALQCASQARDEGRDDETVIAALLHDIGHLCAPPRAPRMGSAGVSHHETIGAVDLRKRRFSSRVTELVSGHVQAKRYLTFKGTGILRRAVSSQRTDSRLPGRSHVCRRGGGVRVGPSVRAEAARAVMGRTR